jgi:hypothetical protein
MGVVLMRRPVAVRRTRRARAEAGLSLIAAAIAAALLLVIAVGTLPMFSQALSNNLAGADSSTASNSARSQTEELYQLPLTSPVLTLVAGTELVSEWYWSRGQHKWIVGAAPAGDDALWTRTSTIRQYSVNAFDDDLVEPSEALDADADPGQVHFKEIEVAIAGTRTAGPLGPSRRVTVRTLKSH